MMYAKTRIMTVLIVTVMLPIAFSRNGRTAEPKPKERPVWTLEFSATDSAHQQPISEYEFSLDALGNLEVKDIRGSSRKPSSRTLFVKNIGKQNAKAIYEAAKIAFEDVDPGIGDGEGSISMTLILRGHSDEPQRLSIEYEHLNNLRTLGDAFAKFLATIDAQVPASAATPRLDDFVNPEWKIP